MTTSISIWRTAESGGTMSLSAASHMDTCILTLDFVLVRHALDVVRERCNCSDAL
jgi:hypothetical protein